MRAFASAIAQGYTYLETDAYATADGVLLAFHDDRLDRVTDQRGAIAELSFADISRAKVDRSEPIPRLEELLTAWPHARVNIDLKSDSTVAPMIALIKDLDCLDRICVGSFSGGRLGKLRAAFGRDLCTSLGPAEVLRLRIAGYGLPSGPFAGRCAQVPETWTVRGREVRLLDEGFIHAAHSRGLPVHVWTVDDRAAMERLLDLGVDGIMTDRPAVLKELLADRAEWVAAD
jgi:glycerophosphoryl diester phosphodiesterase